MSSACISHTILSCLILEFLGEPHMTTQEVVVGICQTQRKSLIELVLSLKSNLWLQMSNNFWAHPSLNLPLPRQRAFSELPWLSCSLPKACCRVSGGAPRTPVSGLLQLTVDSCPCQHPAALQSSMEQPDASNTMNNLGRAQNGRSVALPGLIVSLCSEIN